MPFKHQSTCYRNINGKLFTNYCDLVYGEEGNRDAIKEAKENYKYVRIVTNKYGFKSLFVSNYKVRKNI